MNRTAAVASDFGQFVRFLASEMKPRGPWLTWFNVISIPIMLTGVVILVVRFIYGLASVTNLSQEFPWGLWLGFDVVTGVALAGGAYVITFMVYVMRVEKYHSIVRITVLNSMLAYVFHGGALLGIAVINPCSVQFGGKRRDAVVIGGFVQNSAAGLSHLEIGAFGQLGNLPPYRRRPRHIAALDRIDDDILLGGKTAALLVLDVILVVHVRRGVTHQENDPIGPGIATPFRTGDRLVERLVDAFRSIAAPLGPVLHEMGVDRIEIVGQRREHRNIAVAPVAVAHEPHADARGRFGRGQGIGNGPYFFFGGGDQAPHAAGGIQHEHHFDGRSFRYQGGPGFLGRLHRGEGFSSGDHQ